MFFFIHLIDLIIIGFIVIFNFNMISFIGGNLFIDFVFLFDCCIGFEVIVLFLFAFFLVIVRE